jgi:glutathione S-transferase
MKLYFHPVSTTSRPIMLFAADQRIQLDYQLVDLMTEEQLKAPFTAVNPAQCVPVLEDGDFRLSESSAILKYLAERGSPAYPTDLRLRARVNERMDWFNTSFSRDFCYGLVYPQIFPKHRYPDEQAHAHRLQVQKARAARQLDLLDGGLIGANAYVCGNALTIADYFGAALVTLGEVIRVDYSHWPNVSRWLARMKDREAWSTANEAFYTYLVRPLANDSFVTL